MLDVSGTKYEMVSAIKKSSGWAVSLRNESGWVLIEDLQVKSQSSELLFLDKNYIVVWRLSRE